MKREGPALLGAWALGFLAVMAQTVLLREFLGVAEGNELVWGIVLGCWMVLTGAGAFLARRSAGSSRLHWRILALALLPLCTAVGLRAVRHQLFAPGTMLGLWETLLLALTLLAPFCLVAGHTFVRLAEVFSLQGRSIASAYGWEAAGSVVGGLAGFLLSGTTAGNIAVLCGLVVFGAVASFVTDTEPRRSPIPGIIGLGLVLCMVFLSGTVDRFSRSLLVPGQEVVFSQDTPYGSLVVTETEGERSLYENGVLLSSTGDLVGREEAAHFAMVQRPHPQRILVVSGAASGVLEEVLKYPVHNVDYIELNTGIRGAWPYLRRPPNDPRLTLVEGDVRNVLRSTPGLYDVLLINTPDPTTAQTNRLFTVEFFQLARARMTDSSVLALSLLPTVEYYGDRARLVASSVYGTLCEVFPSVVVVPGERNYFLASMSTMDIGIARLVDERRISTTAVNRYYIDDDLLRDRSKRFVDALDTLAPRNSDLHPVAYFRQIAFWLESIGLSAEIVGWITILLILAGLMTVSRVGVGVYATGFAAAGIEVILLLGYQCLYGFVYRSLWLVIGGFMGGLASGAALSTRVGTDASHRWFVGGLIAIACCAALSAGLLEALVNFGRAEVEGMAALVGLVFLSGAATGIVFGAGSVLEHGGTRRVAGSLYAADLTGSALGSLLTAAFLVPMLGTGLAAGSMAVLPLVAVVLYRIRA